MAFDLDLPKFVPSPVHDLQPLQAEIKRLSVAKYVIGPEGCVGDGDCPEYWNGENGAATGIEFCSHVTHAVATADDAVRLERVRYYLREVDPEAASEEDVRSALSLARRAALDYGGEF